MKRLISFSALLVSAFLFSCNINVTSSTSPNTTDSSDKTNSSDSTNTSGSTNSSDTTNSTDTTKPGVFIDSENKIVYAQGKSLLVKNNEGSTEIWYDLNKNKTIDEGETLIQENTDFSGYSIKAVFQDGTIPDSNMIFTISGGNLLSIEGLGKTTMVYVYLKGNPVIGNENTGIILSSFFNAENIRVIEKLSDSSLISIVTENQYSVSNPQYLAYLENEDNAVIENFKVLYSSNGLMEEQAVAFRMSQNKKALYLSNPTGVGMPDEDSVVPGVNVEGGLVWITDGDEISKTKFTLGESMAITTNSPVFSIKTENGFFKLTETSLKDSEGNILTENLAELRTPAGEQKYHINSELNTETEYKYLHMLSKDNKITPEAVTEFIKSIEFNKVDEETKISITINIETMPYSEIEEKYNTEENNFKYYDGSFYLRVDSSYIDWHDAYNAAKTNTFNGLHGYLMTITSELENYYIFKQLNADRAWMGGTRYKPDAGNEYDSLTMNVNNGVEGAFYWACGPEAGQMIYNGVRRTTADIAQDPQAVSGVYTNFINYGFKFVSDITNKDSTYDKYEPNNGDIGNVTDKEPCLQFFKESKWNDMPEKIVGVYDNPEATTNSGKDWGFSPKSYVVEFRPYETELNTETAEKAPVTMTGRY